MMKYKSQGIKLISLFVVCGLLVSGCVRDTNSEQDIAGVDNVVVDETEPQRYDMNDIDGNGEMEYVSIYMISDPDSEYEGHLDFYFNNRLIYSYDDILYMMPGEASYIDLDHDNEKEIFLKFYPHVNSAPLVEYAVLKQVGEGWNALEMPHGETMLDNAFPISIVYGEQKNTIVISCDGIDEKIVYDITAHYKQQIELSEGMEETISMFENILQGDTYRAGDSFGGVAPWGIWEIRADSYAGTNCLVATHGIEGVDGKFDALGELDVYFDYDSAGCVRILSLNFRE